MEKHDMSVEWPAFEEFVVNSLNAERVDGENRIYKVQSIQNHFSDVAYITVMYGNNLGKAIQMLKECSLRPMFLICLAEGVEKLEIEKSKAFVLGDGFIKKIVNDNPELWWNFVASCKSCPEVEINEQEEKVYINWAPLAVNAIDVFPSLPLGSVYELGKMNIADYKKNVNQSPTPPSVIIGNGVSIPFGSDKWSQLSEYLFDFLSPKYIDNGANVRESIGNTNYSLTSMAKMMVKKIKYRDALYACVYRKYEDDMHKNGNTLLRAIVNAKINHKDLELITYNYDEFLEKDYRFVTGLSMTSVCSAQKDTIAQEPKVKHIHGFIPYNKPSKATSIVLTQEEYYEAYKGNSWRVRVQKRALEGVCLFVGSSLSDLFQMSLINDVKNDSEKSRIGLHPKRKWKCYALLCLKGLSPRDIVTVYNYYLRKGIYLVFVDDYSKLPQAFNDLMNY